MHNQQKADTVDCIGQTIRIVVLDYSTPMSLLLWIIKIAMPRMMGLAFIFSFIGVAINVLPFPFVVLSGD